MVARFVQAGVVSLRLTGTKIEVSASDGQNWCAANTVVSADAYSHRIARTLGEKIPLETERGDNTTLPQKPFDLRTQVTFDDQVLL
jgi:D-amino-acid dehydrogenase